WQWRRAEENRLRAERSFADVRDLATSFLFDFHDAIADLAGASAARELVAARATRYLDLLSREEPVDLGLRRDLAAGYERLAHIQGGIGDGNLGKTGAAMASYGKAVALRQAVAAASGESDDILALGLVQMNLGRLVAASGDWARAEALAR